MIILMTIESIGHYCFIFSNTYQNKNDKGVASNQLPVKYPQPPIVLIGHIRTLTRGIPGADTGFRKGGGVRVTVKY